MRSKIPRDYTGPSDAQQTSEWLYDIIESNEYFVFLIPWGTDVSSRMVAFEEKYYGTKDTALGFKLSMSPYRGMIAVAQKNMTDQEGLDIMCPGAKYDAEKDVFMISDEIPPTPAAESFFQDILKGCADVEQIRKGR